MSRRSMGSGLGVVLLLVTVQAARAQSPFTWGHGAALPGTDGPVHAMVLWDPDGHGPRESLLVIGGQFTRVGGVPASNLAAWDGTAWKAIGGGVEGEAGAAVLALQVYNDALIVAGHFGSAGGVTARNIALWDRHNWRPMGSGLGDADATVRALSWDWTMDLIAAGDFTTAGSTTCRRIARWDGSTWHEIGGGMDDAVLCLGNCRGELVAGGRFTAAGGTPCNGVARWSGGVWQPMGAGLAADVTALHAWDKQHYDLDLFAGGSFDDDGRLGYRGLARWDGTAWQPVGGGLSGTDVTVAHFGRHVYDLLVCGRFESAGGVAANGIARWDGTAWHAMGGGVDGAVLRTAEYDGELWAGGAFSSAGGKALANLARGGPAIRAFLRADSTELKLGEPTTVRLYVSDATGAGIMSVAVDIVSGEYPAVVCEAPVTFVAPFGGPGTLQPYVGTPDPDGGLRGIAASVPIFPPVRNVGLAGPVEVLRFKTTAFGIGNATLRIRNANFSGYRGIVTWGGEVGQDADYEELYLLHSHGPWWHFGDLDGDYEISVLDIIAAVHAYGSRPGDPEWRDLADFENDGLVDVSDITAIINSFGSTFYY